MGGDGFRCRARAGRAMLERVVGQGQLGKCLRLWTSPNSMQETMSQIDRSRASKKSGSRVLVGSFVPAMNDCVPAENLLPSYYYYQALNNTNADLGPSCRMTRRKVSIPFKLFASFSLFRNRSASSCSDRRKRQPTSIIIHLSPRNLLTRLGDHLDHIFSLQRTPINIWTPHGPPADHCATPTLQHSINDQRST